MLKVVGQKRKAVEPKLKPETLKAEIGFVLGLGRLTEKFGEGLEEMRHHSMNGYDAARVFALGSSG